MLNKKAPFSADMLTLDSGKEAEKIAERLKNSIRNEIKRRGLIIGISGGIDSSVCLALAVKAIGAKNILCLFMPEHHSADDTLELSQLVARTFDVDGVNENISEVLSSLKFYERYREAVRQVIPEYDDNWKSKIVIPSITKRKGFSLYSIVALSPEGETIKKRLPLKCYLEILAATNFKQRIRKMIEYYHADRLNYAVIGTPNRLEYDQGFFVKGGDGSADIKPIAHLYKTQVYQLAEHLGVPERICKRPPTTDTYSLEQGQDEFYFSLPYREMDLCLYALNHGYKAAEIADVLHLTTEQVELVYADIERKRVATRYLHLSPQLLDKVPEIDHQGHE